MFLTLVSLAKQKSKNVLVMMESVGSGHKIFVRRAREDDSKGRILFDKRIQMDSLYKEVKKIKSLK